MTANDMAIFLRSALLDGLAARGKQFAVEQNFQPHQLGTNRQPTVYFHHLGDVPKGWAEEKQIVYEDARRMETVETQLYETRIQIAATVDDAGTDPTALTVVDVLRMARQCIQSRAFITRANAAGVGVYRVGDLPNYDVLSDSPGYEKRPTFDIILQHSDTVVTSVESFDHVDNDPESVTPTGNTTGIYGI